MITEFDEKGKIFTNVVSKHAVPVILQTLNHRMHGDIHVLEGERLKDELNHSEKFIALTNAEVQDSAGAVIYRSAFMTLNRDHIIWLIPDENIQDEGG